MPSFSADPSHHLVSGAVSHLSGIEVGMPFDAETYEEAVNSTGLDPEVRRASAIAGENVAFEMVSDPFAPPPPTHTNPFEAPVDVNPMMNFLLGF